MNVENMTRESLYEIILLAVPKHYEKIAECKSIKFPDLLINEACKEAVLIAENMMSEFKDAPVYEKRNQAIEAYKTAVWFRNGYISGYIAHAQKIDDAN